jgi:NAD(P)-dependent dehydrogenase (short-subunit alcohol dehydrogenase family)
VALGARRLDRLEEVAKRVEEAGGRAWFQALDVSDAASIEAFHGAACREFGAIDAVVNNAGMNRPNLLENAAVEDVQYEIAVNLTGPILLARLAIPAMRERRRGDLVFVTSQNAVQPRTYQAAYTAAKAGLEGVAGVLAMELEGTGVRSMIARVGPTGSEFGKDFDHQLTRELLESWKYWGIQRHLHWLSAESVARTIVRTLKIPVEESYPTLIEIMPGGRNKEHGS